MRSYSGLRYCLLPCRTCVDLALNAFFLVDLVGGWEPAAGFSMILVVGCHKWLNW